MEARQAYNMRRLLRAFEAKEGEAMLDDICPWCVWPITDKCRFPALSRVDNKTKICAQCGRMEGADPAAVKTMKEQIERLGLETLRGHFLFNASGLDIEEYKAQGLEL
jgi:hypothetical protein